MRISNTAFSRLSIDNKLFLWTQLRNHLGGLTQHQAISIARVDGMLGIRAVKPMFLRDEVVLSMADSGNELLMSMIVDTLPQPVRPTTRQETAERTIPTFNPRNWTNVQFTHGNTQIIMDELAIPDPLANTNEREEPPEDLATLHRDLELRYSGCYFIYKGKIKYCSSVIVDANKIKCDTYDWENGRLVHREIVPYSKDFNFIVPKQGYVNTDKYSLYFEREHRKTSSTKFRRGFTEYHFSFKSISHREIKSAGLPYPHDPIDYGQQVVTRSLVDKILFREYPTYQEALDKVISFETLSCAFSTTLCIKLDSLYNKIVLVKNTWIIGEYDKNNILILSTNAFNEELDRYNIQYKEVE